MDVVQTASEAQRRHSAKSAWLICLLFCVSFGLYLYPWAYKTWKFIRDETGDQINPLLRTLALVVPIVSAFFLFQLFKFVGDLTTNTEDQVNDLAGRRMPGMDYSMILFWAGFSISIYFLAARGLLVLIGFASVLFIVWLQRRINSYCAWKYGVRPREVPLAAWIVLVPFALFVIVARVAA